MAQASNALASMGLGLAGLAFLGYKTLFTVDAGHRAIIYSKIQGVKDQHTYTEGTHLLIPFIEKPIVYDVRTQPRVINSLTGTRDLQMVNISLRVLSRPDQGALPTVYRTLGKDYAERVLPSICNEVLKSVVAIYGASQLQTQREQVSRRIRDNLVRRARDFDMIVDDVSITQLTFGTDFNDAVEKKQIAQQQAERAKFIVQQAEQEKKANIIKAQGDAKSAELIGQAMATNPAFIQLRKIEAAKEIATTMSQARNRFMLSSESLLVNMKDLLDAKQ